MTTLEELKELVTTLVSEFKEHRTSIESSLECLSTKIDNVLARVAVNEVAIKEHEAKICTNIDDIKANNFVLSDLKNSVKQLEQDNERLAKSLDDQIDRNMRESLYLFWNWWFRKNMGGHEEEPC